MLDNEGRFVPQNFENLFSKYDKNGTGSLSLRELFDLMHGQRCATDPFGVGIADLAIGYVKLTYVVGSRPLRVVHHLAVDPKGRERMERGFAPNI